MIEDRTIKFGAPYEDNSTFRNCVLYATTYDYSTYIFCTISNCMINTTCTYRNCIFINCTFSDLNSYLLYNCKFRDCTNINLSFTKLIKIAYFLFDVIATDTFLQIGCKTYTYEEWRNFTDEEINEMNFGALNFWNKYKNFLLSFEKVLS